MNLLYPGIHLVLKLYAVKTRQDKGYMEFAADKGLQQPQHRASGVGICSLTCKPSAA